MEKNYTVKKFAALYFNGKPQPIQNKPINLRGNPIITIGDTPILGDKITWIKPKGMNIWIADRPLLATTFANLQRQEFVDGVQIEIDGVSYICRLVRDYLGESKKGSEWRQFLDILGGQINVLNCWTNFPFWVESEDRDFYGVARGGESASKRTRYGSNSMEWGFRPVLQRVRKKKAHPALVAENSEVVNIQYDPARTIRVLVSYGVYRDKGDFFLVEFPRPLTEDEVQSFRHRVYEVESDNLEVSLGSILRPDFLLPVAIRRFELAGGPKGSRIIKIPGNTTIYV